ncbi:MAG: hypothetical protein J6R47_01340 [Acholeplasmatales bacterium]|nr:hypothetical protein [Acholeplasmatales bacterium]
MENSFIEKIKIAELDPSKTYFLQICAGELNAEQFIRVHKILKKEFKKYNINNIILFTPSSVECKFTEIGDKND